MSTTAVWVCANCQRRLRTRLALRPRAQQRSFVSLQDIAGPKPRRDDELEIPSGGRRRWQEKRSQQTQHASSGDNEPAVHESPDTFLEKLFRSTGREPPAPPLRLRYSKRLTTPMPQEKVEATAASGTSQEALHERAVTSRLKESRMSNRVPPQREGPVGWGSPAATQSNPTPTWSDLVGAQRDLANMANGEAKNQEQGQTKGRTNTTAQKTNRTSEHQQANEETARARRGRRRSWEEVLAAEQIAEASAKGVADIENDLKTLGTIKIGPTRETTGQKGRRIAREIAELAKIETWRKPAPIIVRRMRGALRTRDHKMQQQLLRQVLTSIEQEKHKDKDALNNVITDMMSVLVQFGSKKLVAELWNKLHEQEIAPTMKQWSLMLDMARIERDKVSAYTIWAAMKRAKLKPDNAAWTTFISTLCRCLEEPEVVIAALKQMTDQWDWYHKHGQELLGKMGPEEASKYMQSILPFNAALNGMVNAGRRHEHAAQQILDWIRVRNIKPSIDTFNILLRPAVRQGDAQEVKRIMHEMRKHELTPDIYTITTLLDGVLWSVSAESDPIKVEQGIRNIFSDMEAVGISPAPHTYSTALNSLLVKNDPPNVPAARVVLAKMEERGLKPSAHIYTILVTHYFNSSPPNRPAVDALYERLKAERLDHVFYDRLIQGYAKLGEIDRMLAVLRRMPAIGKLPGWMALWYALQTLAGLQEWELVRELVEDVSNAKGMLRLGIRGWAGEREFWGLVGDLRASGNLPNELGDTHNHRFSTEGAVDAKGTDDGTATTEEMVTAEDVGGWGVEKAGGGHVEQTEVLWKAGGWGAA